MAQRNRVVLTMKWSGNIVVLQWENSKNEFEEIVVACWSVTYSKENEMAQFSHAKTLVAGVSPSVSVRKIGIGPKIVNFLLFLNQIIIKKSVYLIN